MAQLNVSFLDLIKDEVASDVNVFGPVGDMTSLCKLDTCLVVLVSECWVFHWDFSAQIAGSLGRELLGCRRSELGT